MKVNIFVCLSVFLISFFTISLNALAGQNDDHRTVILFEQDHHSESSGTAEIQEAEHHSGEHEEGHTTDTAPLLFIILAIIIGVATRHFVKKSPFPFTVLLLIIGLVLGVVNRLGYFGEFHLFNFEFEFTAISKSYRTCT